MLSWIRKKSKWFIALLSFLLTPKSSWIRSDLEANFINGSDSCFKGYYGPTMISEYGHLSFISNPESDNRKLIIIDAEGDKKQICDVIGFNFQDGCRQFFYKDRLIFTTTSEHDTLCSYEYNLTTGKLLELPFEASAIISDELYFSIDTKFYAYFGSEYAISMKNVAFNSHDIALRVFRADGLVLKSYAYHDLYELLDLKGEFYLQHFFDGPGDHALIFLRSQISPRINILLFNKNTFEVIKLHSDNSASHLCWVDENSFLIYGLDNERGYQVYDINSNNVTFMPKSSYLHYSDGHPIMMRDRLVTDT